MSAFLLCFAGVAGCLMLAGAGLETLLFRRVPDGTGALALRAKPLRVLTVPASITSREVV
jgi:hypothetical protein